MSYRILLGDVLERLRELPDESVHCVVTSPPYWGLRDYGTGTWVGGDSSCKHIKGEMRRGVNLAASAANTRGGAKKIAEVEDIPYGNICGKCGALRVDQQIGLEDTPEEFIAKLVEVFREVRRVLRSDGTCWMNMGDSYYNGDKGGYERTTTGKQNTNKGTVQGLTANRTEQPGLKPKDLMGMPWMLAFALRADGWWLRQDIIWAKPNPMPESVTDRCTKAHEYLFLLTKSGKYFYDAEAIKEDAVGDWNGSEFDDGKNLITHPSVGRNRQKKGNAKTFRGGVYTQGQAFDNDGEMTRDSTGNAPNETGKRNKRSVWNIATEGFPEAHFATFPTKLVEPCILAGTSERGCCGKCGAPWERKMEAVKGKSWHNHEGDLVDGQRQESNEMKGGNFYDNYQPPKMIGWQPTCKCDAEVVPCTVMDIFNGSGTTGVVALRYGRNYLGIELNPEYRAMAERRIGGDSPLFNVREEDSVAG